MEAGVELDGTADDDVVVVSIVSVGFICVCDDVDDGDSVGDGGDDDTAMVELKLPMALLLLPVTARINPPYANVAGQCCVIRCNTRTLNIESSSSTIK